MLTLPLELMPTSRELEPLAIRAATFGRELPFPHDQATLHDASGGLRVLMTPARAASAMLASYDCPTTV
ncbi:MAG: hypothetical protein AAGB04_26090 [Pseudomonadota bacterium]